MTKKRQRPPLFERLKKGLEEAILHAQGKIELKTYALTVPDKPPLLDPAALRTLRERIGPTVVEFAGLMNVPVRTVFRWEDGTQKPTGAAARLIQVYAERPDVAEALKHGNNGTRRASEPTGRK